MQKNDARKKILVMDDEEMVGEIACQMLQYLGFDAVWVTNGDTAVQEYSRQKDSGEGYSAIIMDLSIPGGMGGAGGHRRHSCRGPACQGLRFQRVCQRSHHG